MSLFKKLRSKAQNLRDDFEAESAKKKELKALEKEAYFEAKKEEALAFAKAKVKAENKQKLKDVKEGKKGNWDLFGGAERLTKELAGDGKKQPNPMKKLNEVL